MIKRLFLPPGVLFFTFRAILAEFSALFREAFSPASPGGGEKGRNPKKDPPLMSPLLR